MPTDAEQSLHASTPIAAGAREFFLPGGPVGILIIHGYGGTIGDYRLFGEHLQRRGYTVAGVRLAGHGQSLAALQNTSSQEWQQSVRTAAQQLLETCTSLVIVGSSFGGALAINYARNFPGRLDAIIVVNPAIRYRAGGKLQTIGLKVLRLFTPHYRKPGLSTTDAERYRQQGSMTHWPIDGIFETYRFIRRMVLPHLEKIMIPTLVMAIADDPIVHSDSARLIYNHIGAVRKKLVWLPGKTHRPFRDQALVELMVQEIQDFLQVELPK